MSTAHWTQLRVRYGETDAMGVVYHSNYFRYFEVGRSTTFRSLGYSYRRFETEGFMLPVTHCDCSFAQPARYDDVLWIETTIANFKGARLKLNYRIFKQVDPDLNCDGPQENMVFLVAGSTSHGIVDSQLKPVNIKKTNPDFYVLLENFSKKSEG